MGFDLNRHWQDPSPWAHPTLHAVKQLIVQMNQDPVSIRIVKQQFFGGKKYSIESSFGCSNRLSNVSVHQWNAVYYIFGENSHMVHF